MKQLDTENLPKELLEQLNLKNEIIVKFDKNLMLIIKENQDIGSTLNDIIVKYWEKHKEIIKRNSLLGKIQYLRKEKEYIRNVGKGVYVLTELGLKELEQGGE